MPKEINPWAMYPRKTSTASLPEALKTEITIKAHELIETVLKPKYIQSPPENPQFNYIVDIAGKWYRKAFYFYAEYQVCLKDASALAQQFVANGFFSEHMHVLIDDTSRNRPTRGNILHTLNTVAAATQPDDLILFYYSGHGDVDGNESYLVHGGSNPSLV